MRRNASIDIQNFQCNKSTGNAQCIDCINPCYRLYDPTCWKKRESKRHRRDVIIV